MESILTKQPPRTIREVFDSLPEGTLVQLIENQLVMSPSPTDSHQRVLNRINFLLLSYLEENPIGELRIAPYDVHIDPENVLQPDIIFIDAAHLHKIHENGLHGPPDLVVELLSPSTSKYDLNEKKSVYERSGVQEYWVVEPKTKEVHGYFLREGAFDPPRKSAGMIHSRLLDHEFRF